jgi:hypothetical protein
MSPTSSQDAYEAISVEVEVLSDAEAEEDDVTMCPGIEVEPEVSSVHVFMLD